MLKTGNTEQARRLAAKLKKQGMRGTHGPMATCMVAGAERAIERNDCVCSCFPNCTCCLHATCPC